MAVDAFLKFDGVEGEAVDGRLDQEFRLVGTDFANLGGDFLKLIDDASFDRGASALKIAHDLKISHDLLKIDSDFLKVRDGFLKLDADFMKFGDGVTKFVENDLKIKFTGDDGSSLLADAFHKIVTDFQNTSADFLKLDADFIKLTGGTVSVDAVFAVGDVFQKISTHLQNTGNDFTALADNFLKIADLSDLKIVDQVFVKFSDDLLKVADNLNAVSADFSTIGGDFEVLGDTSDVVKLDQAFIKYAGDFLKLDSDFLKLDTSLHSLGADFLKFNDVLHLKLEPPPEVAQLVQAVAAFGGSSGPAENLATVVVNADTPQQPLVTPPQHG